MLPLKKVFIADAPKQTAPSSWAKYTHIRGYHACRPEDIEAYYREGNRALTIHEKRQNAMRIFSKGLDEIIAHEDSGPLKEREDVWFCLSQQELKTDSGHYLCYGSEYLAGLAASFDYSQTGRFHDLLLNTGTPTIFVCDVPLEFVPEAYLEDIQRYFSPDGGFCIHRCLPESCIVRHVCPKSGRDPLCHHVARKF